MVITGKYQTSVFYVQTSVSYVQISVSYVQTSVFYVQTSVFYVQTSVFYVQISVSYVQISVSYVQTSVWYFPVMTALWVNKKLVTFVIRIFQPSWVQTFISPRNPLDFGTISVLAICSNFNRTISRFWDAQKPYAIAQP